MEELNLTGIAATPKATVIRRSPKNDIKAVRSSLMVDIPSENGYISKIWDVLYFEELADYMESNVRMGDTISIVGRVINPEMSYLMATKIEWHQKRNSR